MKKKSIMSYNDRQLISNIFIKSGDLSYGKIDVQDPRVDTITLLNVDGLKNKQDFVFELQKISCFSTDNFSLYFYTPNNISIFHYLYKENLKKYKLILKNHVLKNDVGNDYEEYNDSPIHKITITSIRLILRFFKDCFFKSNFSELPESKLLKYCICST